MAHRATDDRAAQDGVSPEAAAPAANSADNPADNLAGVPSAEPVVVLPAEPADSLAGVPADDPADSLAGVPADDPADNLAGVPADDPADNLAGVPADDLSDNLAGVLVDGPSAVLAANLPAAPADNLSADPAVPVDKVAGVPAVQWAEAEEEGAATPVQPVVARLDPVARPEPLRPALDGAPVERRGELSLPDTRSYLLLPVEVPPGTTRLEVGYAWSSHGPETQRAQTVVDLGLWDTRGPGTAAGFRGWSGSRQGRLDLDQPPVYVQADAAERGYRPGPVQPGTWHIELGFGAVHPEGGWWSISVRCVSVPVGPPTRPDPVDPGHIARAGPGWYRADLHLHGFHSHPDVPDWDHVVAHARRAELDILPVTEYVTTAHWDELGAVQRAHPDLLVWPGREVITYFGHAVVHGETPGTVDHRHGHDGVDLGQIQWRSVAEGGLFQVAHPTSFPGEAFAHHCRGCEFALGDTIDWDHVDALEVVTGPALVDAATFASAWPDDPAELMANPFVATAVALWDEKLRAGYRITAVSGSDDKLGDGYGRTATRIWATELSRAAVEAALRAGHAYVEVYGAASPELTMTASTADGQTGTFGDSLAADRAEVTVTVTGGAGQDLVVLRNGYEHHRVGLATDEETHVFVADRAPSAAGDGPLGTYWRVETRDTRSPTTLGNPLFLVGAP